MIQGGSIYYFQKSVYDPYIYIYINYQPSIVFDDDVLFIFSFSYFFTFEQVLSIV